MATKAGTWRYGSSPPGERHLRTRHTPAAAGRWGEAEQPAARAQALPAARFSQPAHAVAHGKHFPLHQKKGLSIFVGSSVRAISFSVWERTPAIPPVDDLR